MGAFHHIMDAIASQTGLIAPEGMVVAGHSRQTELRAAYGSLHRVALRQYGDNVIDLYLNEQMEETVRSETGEAGAAW